MSQVLCPVLAVDHRSIITRTNINSILPNTFDRSPGTRVSVSCYVPASYKLQGPSQIRCNENGQWSPGVPTCVKKATSTTGDGTTEGGEPTPAEADSESLSNVSIIVISVAGVFVLILIVILLIFLCKYSCNKRKTEDGMKKPIVTNPVETPHHAKVEYVKMDLFSAPSTDDILYTGPDYIPSWHNHPIILMADSYSYRTWSQLSVDGFLREIDASKRQNPNHSWRDFTDTISSYYSRNFSVI